VSDSADPIEQFAERVADKFWARQGTHTVQDLATLIATELRAWGWVRDAAGGHLADPVDMEVT
jgi:hypothetical protein